MALGEIKLFAGDYAPKDWAICDGRQLLISRYGELYALLGTNFGGDGMNTFGLPDLRGRVAIGAGEGQHLTARTLGRMGGNEYVTLTTNQLPPHGHSLLADDGKACSSMPENQALARNQYGWYKTGGIEESIHNERFLGSNVGGGSHYNMQPYLTLNFIIALKGGSPQKAW